MIKKFKQTIGHEKQKQYFAQVIKNRSLAHAYALVGPSQIGKTTFARDLSEILGAHGVLDLFLHEEAFTIEKARQLQQGLRLKSTSGGYKVAVIAKTEIMTEAAANALLKVLEEPPDHSVIFVITTNFYQLLPTIASRTQKISFQPLSDPEMSQGLVEFNLSSKEGLEILELANGRLGFARELASDAEFLEFYRQAEKSYQVLTQGRLRDGLVASQDLAKLEGEQVNRFLSFAMEKWFVGGQDPEVGRKLSQAYQDLRANLNTKLVLDNLFIV